jgi:hypothetical protein
MKNILLFLVLLCPYTASACSVANISTPERIIEAHSVYFGYVTAIHLKSFELQKEKDDLFALHDFMVGSDLKTYRIVVKESFKGKSRKLRYVEIEECGGGEAELGNRVVVYTSKFSSYIEPLSEELYKSIKSGAF